MKFVLLLVRPFSLSLYIQRRLKKKSDSRFLRGCVKATWERERATSQVKILAMGAPNFLSSTYYPRTTRSHTDVEWERLWWRGGAGGGGGGRRSRRRSWWWWRRAEEEEEGGGGRLREGGGRRLEGRRGGGLMSKGSEEEEVEAELPLVENGWLWTNNRKRETLRPLRAIFDRL